MLGEVEVNLHYIFTPACGQQNRSRCLGQVNNILHLPEFEPESFGS